MSVLTVSGLSKTYATGFHALKNVNLEIRRGEIFALLGPNGAGKTTLINIICGIVTPSSGSITADGHDIDARFPRGARADRPGAAGAGHRHVRDRVEHHAVQPRAVRQAALGGVHREGAARPVAVGQEGLEDHDALGRHEAPRDDRQGAVARTQHPVPRRAHGRRRRRAAARHVADGARPARARRHHHPHHALHRGSRGDGRPHRRHQQGRADRGRGEERADAQARQEAAHAAPAECARPRFRRRSPACRWSW